MAADGEDQNDGADWGYENDEPEDEHLASQDMFIGMANSTRESFKVEAVMERFDRTQVRYCWPLL